MYTWFIEFIVLLLQDAIEVKRFEEELARTKYSKVCFR